MDYAVQFDDKRKTLPRLEIQTNAGETQQSHKDVWTGDAWPSSVRDLNCSLKWGNERNPRWLLQVSTETTQHFVCEANKVVVSRQ